MNFYIADTHIGHDNIIRLSKRPFRNVQEMNNTIINNWNSVITDNDDVYILGDLFFRSQDDIESILKKLKGKKHLIVGNHDKKTINQCRKYFVEIKDMITVVDGDYKIVCCHYPLAEWDGYFRGTLHFYGHVHNNTDNRTNQFMESLDNAYNVGVDIIGFTPRTAKEILKSKKTE